MREHGFPICHLTRLLALAAGIAFVCCSGSSCATPAQLQAQHNLAQPTPAVLAGLPQLSRLASASGDFLPFQNGADFAADLNNNRCVANGTAADYTPDYVAPNKALSDAAYGLYRLELDPAAVSATLSLSWNGAAPGSTDCWIGLANWGRDGWDWQPLTSNDLVLNAPALYADASKHCYAAVMFLGSAQYSLVSISFGPLPPPVSNGYTLFAPIVDTSEYLIDDTGTVVHSWAGTAAHGMAVELTADGHLWRQVKTDNPDFQIGGAGGRLEEVDWNGSVIWSYELSTTTQCTHHDFEVMPNGHVLLTVWNKIAPQQAISAGRNPLNVGPEGIYVDSIVEIDPAAAETKIIWQWNVMDHLVQDFDSMQSNYGDPSAHPELINYNYASTPGDDWTHINSVNYNPELDQIVISAHGLSELWVIDHSTTTEEAAGHSGGRIKRGGDLLYRWGNPAAYDVGLAADRKLFAQHDVHWIKPGLTGAGDLLIFNNRAGAAEGRQYSTVVEVTPPLNPDGSYMITGDVYGPAAPTWQYIADPPEGFFSLNISSAQRLPDGNTLICSGQNGLFFEVTPPGEIVWQYKNPFPNSGSVVFRATRYPVDYPGLANLTP